MSEFSEDIEKAITTPHEHEHTEYRPPLWILWKIITDYDGVQNFPSIDVICDSEKTIRYNIHAVQESYGRNKLKIFIERIPANHRFASSLEEVFTDASLTTVKTIENYNKTYDNHRPSSGHKYAREGD